jgi:Flp pilus assembly protein TadG
MIVVFGNWEMRSRRRQAARRWAASAVEFAFVAPVLATMVLGMIELGRGIMVKEMLSDAAQKACRKGALPGKANTDVQAEVDNIMSDNGITGYSTTIQVNGSTVDVNTANKGDQISVKVSVPVSQVYWMTTFFVPSSDVESETVIMMRQG